MYKKRRSFTAEFKQDAVALANEIGPVKAAESLDVHEVNIRRWMRKLEKEGASAFAPGSEQTDAESELRRLRKEVQQLQMERDILKKAAAFFAKESE